jgi:Flp pilus assembly protein TadD
MLEIGISIFSLISLLVFVIVLIKQFKHGGALHGIIGLITCGFWTFIWGWTKHKSLAMTKLMIIWTVIQVTPLVLIAVFGVAMIGQVYKLVGDLAGDPTLLIKQDQKRTTKPGLKKKGTPITLPKQSTKKAPVQKDTDWTTKALALWEEGKYTDPNKAKSYWDRAIATNPKFAEAYNNRGLAFYNLNLYQEALKDFSQSIRMKPNYAEAFNNRGNVYYELDQYEKAQADFDQSLKLKPKYSKAQMNRGLVFFQMQKLDQACNDFRKACDLGECDGLQWSIQNGFCK